LAVVIAFVWPPRGGTDRKEPQFFVTPG